MSYVVNAFRNLGEVSSLGRLTARNSCEGKNRRTINWLRGRRRRRRRIAKTDQAVSRATGLFMHLRDSGFKRVPRTSKQEVPGESREYRSSSWTQIIICRTYSVLYAGMRLLYDATQPMLARDSRLLPSTLTLLFACHSVYTTIFCVCVRMLRKSLRYQILPLSLLRYSYISQPNRVAPARRVSKSARQSNNAKSHGARSDRDAPPLRSFSHL